MEDAGTITKNAEWTAEEQQRDQNDSEVGLEQQHKASKSQRTIPQKLKTSEKRRIQNRAAQKTYR